MDNISMQKEEFQFDFFPQSSSPLLFRPDSDQENEPFEQTHKLRKLNPHSPDTNSHNTSQNIPHKSSLLVPIDTKAPTQPEKQLVKPNYSSLSGMDHLRKYLGDNYPAVVKKALAKLQPLSAQPYHAQLEQMRLLGIHQEKEVENHIILRKGHSASTATCSPCSSLRSSFNCLLSPGNDEELKMSMVDGSNSTMNGDLKKEVQNHKKAQMAANTNLRRTVSLPPEANPLMKEGSTTGDLMSQVLPLSPEMNAKKLNNTQAPFPQYQNQQQVDMGWNSQLEAPMITRCLSQGMANVGDQAGKSYRSLVDSQMQAIQSLVQNKRSFNQMNSLQNNGIQGNYNQVQGLGAQRTVSGGPLSTPNDSEAMKKLWIQRWNYQRAMQYRAAAMQKKSFMMMQEKLEMKNDQNNMENTTVNNVMDFQPNTSKVLPDQGLEFSLQENQKADNIDHFFVTSDQPVLQEKLITENHASDDFIGFNNKEFFNTENLLDPFAEDAIGSHKKGWLFDEDDTPLSLRNIF